MITFVMAAIILLFILHQIPRSAHVAVKLVAEQAGKSIPATAGCVNRANQCAIVLKYLSTVMFVAQHQTY